MKLLCSLLMIIDLVSGLSVGVDAYENEKSFLLRDPNLLSVEDYSLGVSRRKQDIARVLLLNESSDLSTAFLFAEAGRDYDFNATVIPVLEHLSWEEDPDMYIIQLVRLMYIDNSTVDSIIPTLQEIPLWVNFDETLRIYWSENHMLMYISSRFLLEELLGDDVFYPQDSTLREKLIWFLKVKIDSGYYEFYSHYLRFTISALLNLYDLSKDAEIVDLAKQALIVLLKEFAGCYTTDGFCAGASGRAVPDRYADRFNVTSEHVMAHILLGTELASNDFESQFMISALVHSDIDLSEVRRAFKPVDYLERRIGHSRKQFKQHSLELKKNHDRYVAQMTMGGYAHPDYITDSLTLVDEMNLWQHNMVKAYSFAQNVPRGLWRPFSAMVGSVTKASLLNLDYVMWKNYGASLSSIKDYYPGYRGYQQMPWMAATGDVATWTMSLDSSTINSTNDIDNYFMNYQLPRVIQDENIALLMYNPNADLKYLFVERVEVILYFDGDKYDEVVEQDKWIIGSRKGSYVAIHRHCVGEQFSAADSLTVCFDSKQIWAIFVGNEFTHGSFANFTSAALERSVIEEDTRGTCIHGYFAVDGKYIGGGFCRDIGNVNRAIIVLVFSFVGLVMASIVMWKFSVASKTRKVIARRMSQGSQVLSRKFSAGSEIMARRLSRAASLRKPSLGSRSDHGKSDCETEVGEERNTRARTVTFEQRDPDVLETPTFDRDDDAMSIQSEPVTFGKKRSVTFDDAILRSSISEEENEIQGNAENVNENMKGLQIV